MLFKFRIYDFHYYPSINEDKEVVFQVENLEVKTFHLVLDLTRLGIEAYRSDVIFDANGYPIECTKVYLSDGSTVFATSKLDTFEANYAEFLKKLIQKIN